MTTKQLKNITSICDDAVNNIECDFKERINQLVNLNPIYKDFSCSFDDDFVSNQLPIITTTLCYFHNQMKKQNDAIQLRNYFDACQLFIWFIGNRIIEINQNTDFAKFCFDRLDAQFYPNL